MTSHPKCFAKHDEGESRDTHHRTCTAQQSLAPFVNPSAPNGAEEPT
mgnify:CR=1 FL=1